MLITFSFKQFQVESILCKSDEGFANSRLLKKPIDTMDFIDRVENLTRFEWFESQKAEWRYEDVQFQEILTEQGRCFNVNFETNKVYNYEMWVTLT